MKYIKNILTAACISGLALYALGCGSVTKPYTFVNGTTADANQVNANYDTLYTLVNGNLTADNLATHAVTEPKIDWGTGVNQVSAVNMPIADLGGYFSPMAITEVENALQMLALGTTSDSYTLDIDNANTLTLQKDTFTAPRTWVFQNANDYVVGRATTDNLTNKTITSATFGGTMTGTYTLGGTPSLTSPTITTSPTAAGATWVDLGAVTTVDINGGTIDGVTIGATVAPTVTNLGSVATADINGGTIDGVTIGATAAPTVTNLGSVATADINGGTIDGVTIGGTAPGTGSFSTMYATDAGITSTLTGREKIENVFYCDSGTEPDAGLYTLTVGGINYYLPVIDMAQNEQVCMKITVPRTYKSASQLKLRIAYASAGTSVGYAFTAYTGLIDEADVIDNSIKTNTASGTITSPGTANMASYDNGTITLTSVTGTIDGAAVSWGDDLIVKLKRTNADANDFRLISLEMVW